MSSTNDKTAKDRVARHTERQLDAGLVRVHVWVPACQREALLNFAAALRDTMKK